LDLKYSPSYFPLDDLQDNRNIKYFENTTQLDGSVKKRQKQDAVIPQKGVQNGTL